MDEHRTGFLGTPLYGEIVEPSVPARAALLIVHGICEHSGRYREAAARLAARGMRVYLYDQRGHGRSPGPRVDIERFEDFVRDLHAIVRAIATENPGLPLFVWAHSMGSIVAILGAANAREPLVRGVITTGCPLAVMTRFGAWVLPLGRAGARVLPRLRVRTPLGSEELTRDVAVQRAYENDPLVVRSATLRLAAALGTACDEAREAASRISVPWLALHGSEDRISPPQGSRDLIERLASSDERLVIMNGCRHELHNELEPARSEFFDTVADWILDRAGAKG